MQTVSKVKTPIVKEKCARIQTVRTGKEEKWFKVGQGGKS